METYDNEFDLKEGCTIYFYAYASITIIFTYLSVYIYSYTNIIYTFV